MELYNVLFCERAINEETGVSAANILSCISPEYIPGQFSFSVILTILGIQLEDNNNIIISFKNENDVNIVDVGPITMPVLEKPKTNIPDEYFGLNLALDLNNVKFESSGLYRLEIKVNEKKIGEKAIYVKGKNE